MRAELCKTCAHMEVCGRDKNIVGDVYVPPSPLFFDGEYRKNAWESFKKREAEGFPCDAYLPTIDPVKHARWIVDYGACEPDYMECSCCNWITEYYGGLEEEWNYCPNCGAKMSTSNNAHWIKQPNGEYKCSVCGDTTLVPLYECHTCGARMDEVKE